MPSNFRLLRQLDADTKGNVTGGLKNDTSLIDAEVAL